MTEFYQYFQGEGLNKAQALRKAMLEVSQTSPNPRQWAAFTIIGEAD